MKNQRTEDTAAATTWSACMEAEARRDYAADAEEGTYMPGSMSKTQLVKAANEFVKRCNQADAEYVPLVLISRNCEEIPSLQFERDALSDSNISKLWYALTPAKDLFIIKYASDITHGDAIAELVGCTRDFGKQFGARGHRVFHWSTDGKRVLLSGTKVAPDALLQQVYPAQALPQQLRAPFVVELEYENRTPKALMLQLDAYLLQQVADYVLGIKVYKRSGPAAPPGAKRPFAAIALLWRRGAAPPGGLATLVGVWSFGTCDLTAGSKRAFCHRRGQLQQVRVAQIVHPATHTPISDTITIPKAHLVQGVVDENGHQVAVLPTDNDLTIDLGEIRGLFDDNLPL